MILAGLKTLLARCREKKSCRTWHPDTKSANSQELVFSRHQHIKQIMLWV
jgi:hypothetical protein